MAVNQKAIKVLNKIFEAGYTCEKDIAGLTLADIINIKGISIPEMIIINDLQKSIKTNSVITFLGNSAV